MTKTVHIAYLALLFGAGLAITVGVSVFGAGYYFTPLEERPFHPQYELLKPTGLVGEGYGIIGSFMVITGVAIYSSRKRLRIFSGLGKAKHFLEFHIFLCLTGPILILFHTTFKFGGLVAVSFWSMLAVVLSGLVGRYLFVQIPRGIQGNELTMAELAADNEKLAVALRTQYGFDTGFIQRIDAIALPPEKSRRMKAGDVLRFFVVNDLTRRSKLRSLYGELQAKRFPPAAIRKLRHIANKRVVLTRRIAFLEQFHRLFHYWHVIHLPFSIIMFVILLMHVGVAIAFGYRWIW
jgi:hypothetical protein